MRATIDLRPYRFASRALLFAMLYVGACFLLDPAIARLPASIVGLVAGVPPELPALREASGRVVYLGDSVVGAVAPGEDPMTRLVDIVARDCGCAILRVNHPSYGPAEQLAQLQFVSRGASLPRAVIVPVNLRAFSPHWTERPAWNFRARNAMLRTGWFLPIRLLVTMKYDFGALSTARFEGLPVTVRGAVRGTMLELDGRLERPMPGGHGRYVVRYATDAAQSPTVRDLRALLDFLERSPIPSVVYFTPVDLEGLAAELSEDDMASVQRNVETIRGILGRRPYVDLSAALPHSAFCYDPTNPTEHLCLAGREVVASRVAAELAALH
ncbi:MAG: hypothetical protein U0166_11440 [Acidobacteriota bacterium]